ncbi:type I methionyl aminopeptidase [Cellulomonas sp. NPDC089187]|uniref:type I methionyl aminopeptidase n=1 Tax=Cellulomonas sp. NPDC089187 TaxID=3154970 RepID=UPI0034213569
MAFGREKIELKTPEQIRLMRRAGLVVAEALAAAKAAARPGATTADLDGAAAAVIAQAGATPSFLGYYDYPATICVSVNEEVVHGIPGDRVLQPGDLVSIDCGAIVEGWHGDSALSLVLDDIDPADAALVEVTRKAMWDGIAALWGGDGLADRLNVVGDAVEDAVDGSGIGYGIVEEYVGHGIGSQMHLPPDVLNYRVRDRLLKLKPGMCLAIEPMITRGTIATETLDDDWTVITADGSRAAHWEHSVALFEDGLWVLTADDGGLAELGARGVPVAALD